MLLRDGPVSPEVLMIERHSQSVLLPDMYVFPGGRVDEHDVALVNRLGGLDGCAVAEALGGGPPEQALSFVVAAVRETFEEAGILLARERRTGNPLPAERAAALASHRLDVQAGTLAFGDLVESEDLELAGDCLALHARWITPELLPYRFDTLFFTALAPTGQSARADGIEISSHMWIRPEDALAQLHTRARRIIFPTAVNLESVGGFGSVVEILDASRRRRIVPVLPRLVEIDGEQKLVIPADAGYATTMAPVDQLR
jgi:8-oxo-dGTP pyrophosphatase MutT (NUDIX family)